MGHQKPDWEKLDKYPILAKRDKIVYNNNQLILIESEIKKSGLFDEYYYLENNPDCLLNNINPIMHYLFYGAFEGYNPSKLFCSKYYLENNPDVAQSGINPLLHYIMFGKKEGRKAI